MSGPSHQREQKERREIITAEARARKADTMSSWARAEHDLENVGRFAKGTTITGADPATHYPRLPPGPWSGNDPVGVEPPLGIDVNETPLVGEAFEIERSLQANDARGGATQTQPGDAELVPPNSNATGAGDSDASVGRSTDAGAVAGQSEQTPSAPPLPTIRKRKL